MSSQLNPQPVTEEQLECLGPRYVESPKEVMEANAVFEAYSGMMPKSSMEAILNLECGSGNITEQILKPYYESSRVIGIDKYYDMINYAKTFHHNAEYKAMDITKLQHVQSLKDDTSFEYIFSFRCLHWIHRPKQTLSNIRFLLQHKGRCVIAFVAESPVYDSYKKLAENPRWAHYMQNYWEYIPFTHRTPQHDIPLIVTMSQANLRVKKTQSFLRNCWNQETLINHVSEVNSFISRIPMIDQWAFVEDCIQEILNTKGKLEYTVVSALAEKTKEPLFPV